MPPQDSEKAGLKAQLIDDMKAALRAKQTVRLETVRMLRAAVQRKEVDAQVQLDDNGVRQVVQKLLKQCQEAAAQFTQGGRDDLVQKELANIEVLQTYLPTALSESEVDALLDTVLAETGATTRKDMGKVMAALKTRLQGRADMGAVSAKVQQRLT